jgi:hypothetical protein
VDPNAALRDGTLMEMYQLSRDPKRRLIINALDIPMGDISVPVPPQYRFVPGLIEECAIWN